MRRICCWILTLTICAAGPVPLFARTQQPAPKADPKDTPPPTTEKQPCDRCSSWDGRIGQLEAARSRARDQMDKVSDGQGATGTQLKFVEQELNALKGPGGRIPPENAARGEELQGQVDKLQKEHKRLGDAAEFWRNEIDRNEAEIKGIQDRQAKCRVACVKGNPNGRRMAYWTVFGGALLLGHGYYNLMKDAPASSSAAPPTTAAPNPAPTTPQPAPPPAPPPSQPPSEPAPPPGPPSAPVDFSVTVTTGFRHPGGSTSRACAVISTNTPLNATASYTGTVIGPAVESGGTFSGFLNAAGRAAVEAVISAVGSYNFLVSVASGGLIRTGSGSINVTSAPGNCVQP